MKISIVKFTTVFLGIFLLAFAFTGCPTDGGTTTSTEPTTTTSTSTTTTTTTTVAPLSWLKADTDDINTPVATARTNGAEDWRDEIIYFIMTDRFKDGDANNNPTSYMGTDVSKSYFGGDFKGIIDNVDYLKKLGVTSIWITPIVQNVRNEDGGWTGYHGYWAQDFSKVDSTLTSATNNSDAAERDAYYKTFIDTMHNNGILVIQDVVVNHMGNIALYKSGVGGVDKKWNPTFKPNPSPYERIFIMEDPEYKDATWVVNEQRVAPPAPFNQSSFFHNNGQIGNYNDDAQSVYGDMSGLDDLATEKTEVRQALLDAYKKWALLGVDGFRMDTVKHVEEGFWDVFSPGIRAAVKNAAATKKFMQFGEALIGSHAKMATFASGSRLDSMLNFDLFYKIHNVFSGGGATSNLTTELSDRAKLMRGTAISDGGAGVSAVDGAINFIDNHDEGRFISTSGNEIQKRKMYNALMYIMTTRGIPCIYYNTENEVVGSKEAGRHKMPDFETKNKAAFTLIRKLAKIRTDNVSLRRGDMDVLKDAASSGVFAFARYNGVASENVIVVMNTSNVEIEETINLKTYSADGDVLNNILFKEFGITDTVTVSGGAITTKIEPYSMKIFKK